MTLSDQTDTNAEAPAAPEMVVYETLDEDASPVSG